MKVSIPVTRMRGVLAALTLVCVALAFGSHVSSQGRQSSRSAIVDGREAVAGEVLVRFARAVPSAERAQIEQQVDADESEALRLDLRRIHSRRFDVQTLVAYLRAHAAVAYAEPNYIWRTVAIPNDPQFGNLWGLLNTGQTINGSVGVAGADIHATPAWDRTTGSRANVVTVVDTGIDYTHPDLAANVWSAPSAFTVTIGGTPITCAAGTHGFNAITKTCDPMDDNNHGSHVSGTIGAVGNNGIGVAGVNWTASIMGSKFLSAAGSGTTANAINAIEFAIQAKAAFAATAGANVRVLSNSWGGGGFSQALLDEINKANTNNMLFVAAAGNNASNNDLVPSYPASYNAPNIIAVAATDNTDHLASFSNFGSSVQLAAPGVDVLSTTIGNTYQFFSGTSMATPHVSGAAALILSLCGLDTAALKTTILNSVDVVGALSGLVGTNGRLNVNNALNSCAPAAAPAAPTGLTATAGNAQVSLKWTAASGAASYNVKRGTTAGGPYTVVATGVATTSYTDTGLTNGTTYFYVVSAVNAVGQSPNSNEASATPTAPPSVPAAPTGLTATSGPGIGQISLTWNASAGATSYNVQRSRRSGGPYTTVATGVTTASFVDSGLRSGRQFFYVVSAVNASGTSPNSNEATAIAK